ncbi:MAG: mechanosensitive ion channel [Candidatus Methanoplasma sp.]|jgi:small-conductance mechanosensitive channel|nr:mechanosensitive ion channel [Candidatus Methanoplasma sp.]
MRRAKVLTVLSAIFALSVLFLAPMAPSDADGTDGVRLVPYGESLKINAGSSGEFMMEVVNDLPYLTHDISNDRMVTVSFASAPAIKMSMSKEQSKYFVLTGKEYRSITVTVSVDKYVSAGTYGMEVTIEVRSFQAGSVSETADRVQMDLTVLSPLSSEKNYNKILGIFDNPLPDPFGGPLVSAVITFLLWTIIGTLITAAAVPLLIRVVARDHINESKKLKRRLKTLIPMVLMLFAFNNSLRVFGASEEIIGSAENWFSIFYIILGAIIAWMIYLVFVQYVTSKISGNGLMDNKAVDIGPLLRLLGKLVISVMSVAFIMSTWGFNLSAIITSAGIVSLGITLGAQNILNQFFSGMVILLTHPFRAGDLVRIGNSSMICRVLSINIMNTVFKNWENEETIVMPNNAVASATIVNFTGDGLTYKIVVRMSIAYGDDIDLARSIMKKAAMDNPNVIIDGSVDIPYTRVTAFLDSGIELTVTCYVYDFNDHGKIGGDLRGSIFKAFGENGITVPFPQMDVHFSAVRDSGPEKDADV